MDYPYAERVNNVIQRYGLKRKTANEHGDKPCPNCGGIDRFFINEHNGLLKHHCRQQCDDLERLKAMQRDGALPERTITSVVPYHHKKGIPLLGARLEGNNVVVPLFDVLTGEQRGQQEIFPDGRKKFSKGMTKLNTGSFIGDRTDILYICEGWADAVAVNLCTGQQAFFALDAKTLPKTVPQLDHPHIIIAADNDDEGITAAKATGKPYALPATEGGDWWDVYYQSGSEAVSEGLRAIQKLPEDLLSGLSISSALELSKSEFAPITWLIDEVLPIPNLVLVGGAPKCGKSWYVMGLADVIASKGHRVVYIANEDNERRLKDRYAKISAFPSDKLIFISGLSSEKPLPKGDAAHGLIRALKQRYPDLKCLVVDTIQAIRDASQKQDYSYVEGEFSKLRKLAHDLEITIVAVHHTKKKTDVETEPLDMVLGSQAIVATVETILLMQRVIGSRDVDLFITGKDVEQREDYRLNWTDSGFSDPQNRTLASLGPIQRAILEHVKNHPRCNQAGICEALGKSKQQISTAVNRLLEMELLKATGGERLICSLTQ